MPARDAATESMTSEEQHDHDMKHVPLPGSKEHTCTDIFWLLFLVLNLGALAYIQKYANDHGNHRKITRGFNSAKELCGVDPNQINNPFIYWCEDEMSEEILATHPLCVPFCPNGTDQAVSCATAVASANLGNETTKGYYRAIQIGHWCVPRARTAMSNLLKQVTGNFPLTPLVEVYGDMQRAGAIILPAAATISVIIGYLYLYLLDKCAYVLCYVCIALLCGSTIGGGGFLVYRAVLGDSETYVPYLGTAHTDLCVGAALLIIGLLAFFLFCCKSSNINQACGCIESACECMMEEPTLLMEPFLALTIKVGTLSVMMLGFADLVTTGEVKLTGDCGIRRAVNWTNEQCVYLAFYVYIFFWVMEITGAASQYVLAWTTQMWYFTPYINDRKDTKLTCGVIQGYWNFLRYHIGTIALGALLIVYFRIVRVILGLLAQAAQMEGNPVGKLLATCCMCCITCFQRFLESLNKAAYMDVALTSSNFCVAAGRALELLTTEVPAVAALNSTQFIFQICGVGLIICCTVWATLVSMSGFSMFSDYGSPYYISNQVAVCAIAGGQAAFIGICFMHVFDTVGDTILYCYASEQRRRALVDHKAYGATHEHELTWWAWLVGEDGDTSDEDAHVTYAPKKLQALVEQHNAGS